MSDHAMFRDLAIGDGGGVTVYERPDGSRYALDRRGRGYELCWGEGVAGPVRFDARPLADGDWPGSRSRVALAA
jgi:hypothetical protein